MIPRTRSRIAGALYDFMGHLTTREDVTIASARHTPNDLLDAFCEWAAKRGLDPNDADVEHWQLGEMLIEAAIQTKRKKKEKKNDPVPRDYPQGAGVTPDGGSYYQGVA